MSDLVLIERKMEMSVDGRGRLAGVRGVTIAAVQDGQAIFIGSEVPHILAPMLIDSAGSSPTAPDHELPALERCWKMLDLYFPRLSLDAGLVYVFEPATPSSTRTDVERSDVPVDEHLRALNPGNWDHDEWNDLLDGTLGPWAMAVLDGRIVSICHTPLPVTEHAAECGVWTLPEARGR